MSTDADEIVPVDRLRVGDTIKYGCQYMRIERIVEFPKTRELHLRWGRPVGAPYCGVKRKTTTVYRKARP